MTRTNRDSSRAAQLRAASVRRDGIVLLVVLGMLALFSVLGASYLVFTNNSRLAATAISRKEAATVDPQEWLDDALKTLLVGATGPDSSLWGHDLLGDLYGMRDAVAGRLTVINVSDPRAPEILLNEFMRLPTDLYDTGLNGSPQYINRRVDLANPSRAYPAEDEPAFETDDEIAGRILTFTQGPLQGISMRIVRYFGDHSNPQTPNGRDALTGQLVLDLRPHLDRAVTIPGGRTQTIAEWIQAHAANDTDISQVVYGNFPAPAFYVNGRILNGPGLGWDVERSSINTTTGSDLNLNETIGAAYNPALALFNPAYRGTTYDPNSGAFEDAVKSAMPFSDGGPQALNVPVALQGHYASYRWAPTPSTADAPSYLQDLPGGDTDEPYDAPDEQNWWLGFFPIDPALGNTAPSFVRPSLLYWLVNQDDGTSLDQLDTDRLIPILRAVQRATLRPLPILNLNVDDPSSPQGLTVPRFVEKRRPGVLQLDYSQFTGSNYSPLSQPIDGRPNANAATLAFQIRQLVRSLAGFDGDGDGLPDWDVDNDGDGIPDGIWIDAGLPLTQSGDGRLMIPLVSYRVEDLGSRVNVNLAGNLSQARDPGYTAREAYGPLFRDPNAGVAETDVRHSDLPTGFGYGPAEIDIRSIFPPNSNGPLSLLQQRLNVRQDSGVNYIASGYLNLNNNNPQIPNLDDYRGWLLQPNIPNLHRANNNFVLSQGLPLDKFGRSRIVLGVDGGLAVAGASWSVGNAGRVAGDSFDDPYEMDPRPGNLPDNAFTLTDLEGILRFNDFDRDALESELVEFANNFVGGANQVDANRRRNDFVKNITTISKSAAINVGVLPTEFRNNSDASRSGTAPQNVVTEAAVTATDASRRNAILTQLLPQEILAGGKLNLNRPFGNGYDDDGDGFIDEPQEVRDQIQFLYRDLTTTDQFTRDATGYVDVTVGEPGPNGPFADPRNTPTGPLTPPPPASPQALFARHLYVLAMSLMRDTSMPSSEPFDLTLGQASQPQGGYRTYRADGITQNSVSQEFVARQVAQWAINVADFRDPDGIMSRFDYDVHPFDGWNLLFDNGNRAYRTVWGMEYPELALEESLAMHNRSVRDTSLDGAERWTGSSFGSDQTLDQWRLPQGSAFFEIRSTRSPDFLRLPTNEADAVAQQPNVPAELYSIVNVEGGRREYMLDLARAAPDRNPVWRIAITRAHFRDGQEDDPELSADFMLQPVGSDGDQATYAGSSQRLEATLQPEQPTFWEDKYRAVGTTPTERALDPDIPIERVVWFTTVPPDNGGNDGFFGDFNANDGLIDFAPDDSKNAAKVFYNRFQPNQYPFGGTFLRGGQYAVVGPRVITHVGSLEQTEDGQPTHDSDDRLPTGIEITDYESPQRFELRPREFSYHTFNDYYVPQSTTRDAIGIMAAADPPENWSGPNIDFDEYNSAPGSIQAIGVNVSEPLPNGRLPNSGQYYPSPTTSLSSDFPQDAWHDAVSGTIPSGGAFYGSPFDGQSYAELQRALGDDGQKTGTRERFKTAYLQRLADPTQPFHEELNPYLTVDYLSIDLTVFNGSDRKSQEEQNQQGQPEWTDLDDIDPDGAPLELFATRYKTGRTLFDAKETAVAGSYNLSHSVNTFPPAQSNENDIGSVIPYFAHSLHINGVDPDAPPIRNMHSSSLGWANASYGERWSPGVRRFLRYAGAPHNDWFSSVTWLNRPFVSPSELMWVPTTSSALFPATFSTSAVGAGYAPGDLYDAADIQVSDSRTQLNRIFPHLPNFFTDDRDPQKSPNFHRILEWVTVPAPFDFENDFISPNRNVFFNPLIDDEVKAKWGGPLPYNRFDNASSAWLPNFGVPNGNPITGDPDTWNNTAPAQWRDPPPNPLEVLPPNQLFWLNRWTVEAFRPPFNILQPQFRQGRININTIGSPDVYRAWMSGITNRSDAQELADGAFRDQFISSRRGFSLADASGETLLPAPAWINTDFFHSKHASAFTGAFRPSTSSDIAPLADDRLDPLAKTMMRPRQTPGATTVPLFSKVRGLQGALAPDQPPSTPSERINALMTERSVAHDLLPISRLNNLATDQSHVFAVWITVGLFEVDGDTMSVRQEIGSELGRIIRYRSFHIIDRSVPVMYQPGQLNNALDTVILSRTIR